MQGYIEIPGTSVPVDIVFRCPPPPADAVTPSLIEIHHEPSGEYLAVLNRAPLGRLHTGDVTWQFYRRA